MKSKLRYALIMLALLVICAFTAPNHSQAQLSAGQNYTLLAPLPAIGSTTPAGCTTNGLVTCVSFETYVQYGINLLIALAAVASVFMIVWGGFEYMTTSVVSGKSDGIKKVTNAIYGLILVLASYLILRTVDPRLVAIPNTLVPQLQLKSGLTQNTSATYFDQLSQEAQQYNIDTAQFGQQKTQAQTTVNSLQQKLTGLQAQQAALSNAPANDPQLQNINAQIQNTQNQISDAEANLSLSTWQAAMSAQMNSGNTGQGQQTAQYKTLSDIKSAETNIQTAYDNGAQDLYTIGGDTDVNVAALNKTYYSTYGNLVIQEANVVLATPNSSVTDFQTAIKDMDLITASFPADMRSQAATLKRTLTNKWLGVN